MNNSTTQSRAATLTEANVTYEIDKVSTTIVAFSAATIGCWATACLFAGTISSGGPLGLLNSLITTIG